MKLGAGTILDLLDRHGIQPSRALGQNFVTDPNTIERIVRYAGVRSGDNVLEIGAGVGSLTVGLVASGADVVALELDEHLLGPLTEVLRHTTRGASVEVKIADAMKLDWEDFFASRDKSPWNLIANLPYNMATPMLVRLLEEAPLIKEALVLVQSEVAERLAAGPGSAAYGIPSVKVAYWGSAEVVGKVSASVFYPVPKVESSLVRITRFSCPATSADYQLLFDLVAQAFGQRRKMLRRSLGGRVSSEVFREAGVEPTLRPQDLDVRAWGELARVLAEASSA